MEIITRIASLPYIIKLKGEILALKLKNEALQDDLKHRVYKEYIQVKNESDIEAKNKQIAMLKQKIKDLKTEMKGVK